LSFFYYFCTLLHANNFLFRDKLHGSNVPLHPVKKWITTTHMRIEPGTQASEFVLLTNTTLEVSFS
jgi:hypothetical protein